jgi:hypothetical protein
MAMGDIKLMQPIDNAVVKKAKFRFEFFNPDTKKTKTIMSEISTPYFCSMKSDQHNLIKIVHYYLNNWKIENDLNPRLSNTASDISNVGRPFVGQRTDINVYTSSSLTDSKTY